MVYVPTFFTDQTGYDELDDVTKLGIAQVAYLQPGSTDKETETASEGEFDYGGKESQQVLRDVIRYASGDLADTDGMTINERSAVLLNTDHVGLYAFSHPGIAATNVMATYGDELENVQWFVGRENPTIDKLSAVELGHMEGKIEVLNPLYQFPDDYAANDLALDYASIDYDAARGVPYFDLDGDGVASTRTDYVLGNKIPTMFGKKYYSFDLLSGLERKGIFDDEAWPEDLATPQEASREWALRSTIGAYPLLRTSAAQLHVMLVFAESDHVQPAPDKPHIHQAYDGFTSANLWVRLNPDQAYVSWINSALGNRVADNDANDEPADWSTIEDWAYPNTPGASTIVPLAAVAEMADRTHKGQWEENLSSILIEAQQPSITRE